MADFSVILQDPQIRPLVQENILERVFHDGLFPALLFREDAEAIQYSGSIGDSPIFSGVGMMEPDLQPIVPGMDVTQSDYPKEQWGALIQQYGKAAPDTHMPTSAAALASLFLRNAHQLGLHSGQTLNRLTRNRMYNAALSGNTVADGAQVATTTLLVKRLNGFTTARNPSVPTGSTVRFEGVSSANPLPVLVEIGGVLTARNVIGFAPTNPGDTLGPGTLTLDVAVTVVNRAAVLSVDRSVIMRVGGGTKVDVLNSTSLFRLVDVRSAVSRLRSQNVPMHADRRYHCHFDPTSQAQIFSDPEFNRLLTSLPDYYMYKDFALGELLNTVFFTNTEAPLPETVVGGKTATYSLKDPFGAELWSTGATTGVKVHRPIFSGQGGIKEYWMDQNLLLTDAGTTGKIGNFQVTNNGIEVMTDRIRFILRSPLDRLQQVISAAWSWIGDHVVRTDAVVGDDARYKRFVAVEHGE